MKGIHMQYTHRCSIAVILLSIVLAGNSFAQSLSETLSQLSATAGKIYIQPAVNAFGVSVNGGWLTKPPEPATMQLDLELGFVAMGTRLQTDQRSFSLDGTFRFTRDQATTLANEMNIPDANIKSQVIDQIASREFPVRLHGPTVVGSGQSTMKVVLSPNGDETLTISDPNYPFPISVIIPSVIRIVFCVRMAISCSWVTITMVIPKVPFNLRISSSISAEVIGSKPALGSSK